MLHASHQTTNYPKNRKSVLTQTHIKKNTHQTQYFWRTIIIIHPLNTRVVGAPQMISQPVSSIFPCSPLPSGTCCLPTYSSVCLVFFSLSLCLARRFWPDLMNRRHDHTTVVCVSLQWSGGLCLVQLPAGSWHGLPRWQRGLCMRCIVSCGSTSFPWLVFFFGVLLWGSMIHKRVGKWMWQGSTSVVFWNWEEILLSFQTGFNLVIAAAVGAVLESVCVCDRSSGTSQQRTSTTSSAAMTKYQGLGPPSMERLVIPPSTRFVAPIITVMVMMN